MEHEDDLVIRYNDDGDMIINACNLIHHTIIFSILFGFMVHILISACSNVLLG